MNLLYDFNIYTYQIFDSVLERRKLCHRDIVQNAQKNILSFNSIETLFDNLNLKLSINERSDIIKEITDCILWSSKTIKPKLCNQLKLMAVNEMMRKEDYKLDIVILKPEILNIMPSFKEDLTKLSKIYIL